MNWVFVAMPKEAKKIDKTIGNIVITGIGAKNVIQKTSELIRKGKIKETDKIINVGYVGSKEFRVGDVVSVYESSKHIKPKAIKEEKHKLNPIEINKTKCYTSDDFCDIMPKDGVVDMELFYLASFFKDIKSIKIVSDCGDYDEYKKNVKDLSWSFVNKLLKEETTWTK